ncbi:hypothetical protein NP493_46g00000, partial [Ridgeia piscesae]
SLSVCFDSVCVVVYTDLLEQGTLSLLLASQHQPGLDLSLGLLHGGIFTPDERITVPLNSTGTHGDREWAGVGQVIAKSAQC